MLLSWPFRRRTLRAARPTTRMPRFRPQLEVLEDRLAPAAVAFDAGLGELLLTGDDADNTAEISILGDDIVVELDGEVCENEATTATLRSIRFNGGAGRDTLTLSDTAVSGNLSVTADEILSIAGVISASSLSLSAVDQLFADSNSSLAVGGEIEASARVIMVGGQVNGATVH